jgi:hypothetical protein
VVTLANTSELQVFQPARREPVAHQHVSVGGWLMIVAGLMLMIAVGWLASWPVVDRLRAANGGLVIDLPLLLLWSLSVPLGGMLVVLGAARVAGASRTAFWLMVCGAAPSLMWFVWLVAGPSPHGEVPTELFGIGGGLVVVSFLGATWAWARQRPVIVGLMRLAADLKLAALALHLFAAWYLCGLLGPPVFLLRPALAATSFAGDRSVLIASTVMVCLVIGWVLQCAASLVEQLRLGRE